jgi:hypothetical protein
MPSELEKFAEWKSKFPNYAASGLLEWIKDVALETIQSSVLFTEQAELSDKSKKYLSDNFGVNMNSHPSVIEFLTYDFLSEVKGFSRPQLSELHLRISNPVSIELLLLKSLFTSQELTPNLSEITKTIHSLIDRDALHKAFGEELAIEEKEDEFALSQIIFYYGGPLFADLKSYPEATKDKARDNLQNLFHEMTRHETDTSQIIHDLLFNPSNLTTSLAEFFEKLPLEILARGELEASLEELQQFCQPACALYLQYYQQNPSLFVTFKPRFSKRLTKEEIAVLTTQKEGADPTEAAINAVQKSASGNFENIFKLSRELFLLCAKQNLLPETAELTRETVILKFSSELLKQHYDLDGRGKYLTGDFQMDEVFGFLMESFINVSLKEMHLLETNLEKLRPEIKKLKTKGKISEKAAEYLRLGLSDRTLMFVTECLKPLQEEVKRDLPNALAMCNGAVFNVVEGFQQLIAKSFGVATSFEQKYREVEQELTESERKLADAEQRLVDEEIRQLREVEAEFRRIHLELQREKDRARSAPSRQEISFGERTLENAGLIEMKGFKGEKTFADKDYTRDNYKVCITKEMYDLINSSDKRIGEAVKTAIDAGFLHAKSKGDNGIKPMDHAEKVNGYVIVEVKLTGKAQVGSFLSDPQSTMGNIRFCGTLKEGVLLITHATLHGEANAELRATAKNIKECIEGSVEDSSINIQPLSAATKTSAPPKSSLEPESGVNLKGGRAVKKLGKGN